MKTITTLVLSMALVLFVAPVQAETSLPSVYEKIPTDTSVAIVIPNVSKLNEKVASLNKTLDLGIPQMNDLLGTLTRELKVQGANNDGSLAILIPNAAILVSLPDGQRHSAMMFMVPVSDYRAFVEGFKGDAGVAVTKIDLPDPQPIFCRDVGGYALIGPVKHMIEAYKPGNAAAMAKSAGTVGTKYLASSDASIMINMSTIAPLALPMMAMGLQTMQEQLKNQPEGVDVEADVFELVKAIAMAAGESASAFVRDTSVIVIGADLSKQGVGFTLAAQFKPESQMAKVFTNGGGASTALSRLSPGAYSTASAMSMKGIDAKLLMNELKSRLPEVEGDKKHWMTELIDASMPMIERTKANASVNYSAGAGGGLGGGMGRGVSVIETTDGAGYVKAFRESMDTVNKIEIPIPMELLQGLQGGLGGFGAANNRNGGAFVGAPRIPLAPVFNVAPPSRPGSTQPKSKKGPPVLTFSATYIQNASKVGDISLDQYHMTVNIPPELLAGNPMGPMMMAMGATGASGYIAHKGDMVVITTAPDPNLAQTALDAVDKNDGFGTKGTIADIRKNNLPPKTVMESYMNMATSLQMISAVMTMMTGKAIDVPPKLPPIASGVGVVDSGIAVRAYLPMPVIMTTKDVLSQLMTQMKAGGGGGFPGLPLPRNAPRR